MLNSMTGFGRHESTALPWGKVSVEMRSSNHKFLETVVHLPDGFLSMEDKIKKEIESKIKRGRITCVVNITGEDSQAVFINNQLLKRYLSEFKKIKAQLKIKDEVSFDTLVHLPGVLSIADSDIPKERIWPQLGAVVNQALVNLMRTRSTEGKALHVFLKSRATVLQKSLAMVQSGFKKVIKHKTRKIKADDERASFLKSSDITEELERLSFHVKNFNSKIQSSEPIGKELDFIAQEMQREANTMGAKSCDAGISARVIQIKSQIEKVREQVQNVE